MNIRSRTIELERTSVIGTVTGTYTIEQPHAVIRRDDMLKALATSTCFECGKVITGNYRHTLLLIDENDHVYCCHACLYKRLDKEYPTGKVVKK